MHITEFLLGIVGYGRATLGSWPDRNVIPEAIATLQEFGAEKCG